MINDTQQKADEYAKKNGMKLEYLDGDEFDTGPGQMRAFLAGYSLANDEKDKVIAKLKNEIVGSLDLYVCQTNTIASKDKRIAELEALIEQREGEAVEFADFTSDWDYLVFGGNKGEGWCKDNNYAKPITTQQLHALFIEHNHK